MVEVRENMGREGYERREKKDKKGREAILTRAENGREMKKGKRLLFFTAYDQNENLSSG